MRLATHGLRASAIRLKRAYEQANGRDGTQVLVDRLRPRGVSNGMTIQGRTAWFAWLGVHLMMLSGTRNRIEVLWDWGWAGMTHERGARIVVDTEKDGARKARRTP